MATATMTTKEQATVPLEVRRRLGLDADDWIEFVELETGGFAIRPAVVDVRFLKGLLRITLSCLLRASASVPQEARNVLDYEDYH